MITGAHAMIFTADEAADRAFLRDVLEIPCIDSGGGWLIFKLPPAELGVHEGPNDMHKLYLMCADIDAFVTKMTARGATTSPIAEQGWGRSTGVTLPGGGTLGVYEPRHARP